MMTYSKEFLAAKKKVGELSAKRDVAIKKLQELCPHVYLNSSSAIPRGPSFQDCNICGLSTYYIPGRR